MRPEGKQVSRAIVGRLRRGCGGKSRLAAVWQAVCEKEDQGRARASLSKLDQIDCKNGSRRRERRIDARQNVRGERRMNLHHRQTQRRISPGFPSTPIAPLSLSSVCRSLFFG